MAAYLLRRVLFAVPILFGVTLITFLVFHVVGGDPAVAKSGRHATPEEIEANRREMGTDRSLPVQYFSFLKETVTFDFGRSWETKRPVRDMIADGVGPSLSLALPAFAIETVLAIVLALFCAFYRGSAADVFLRILAVAAISLPSLAYILFGQYWMGFRWKLFPIFGYAPLPAGFVFLAMPILIWVLLTVGSEMRYYRAVILEEMSQDYVRTAAAKGLRPRRILLRHVLKNSMIPILTRVVITIPFLMLGSLLIEMFFGIPGLGAMTADAISQNDFPVIKALTVIGSVLYVVFSILTDVLYAVVDPRVRLRVSEALVLDLPRRPRALPIAARVVSWPLALGYVLFGLAWRLVLAPFLPRDASGRGGWDRLREFADQGVGYLIGRSDRMPDLSGRLRVAGESSGPWHEAKRRLLQSPLAIWSWIGFAIYVYVGLAAQAGWIASDFRFADREHPYAAPGAAFWLGTDAIGRDVLSLAVRGTMTALWIGAVAASIACAIGMVLGAVAGYFGGWIDDLVVWLYTTLESIPQLLLLLAFAYVVRANPWLGETYDASFLKQGLGVSLGLFSMIFTIGVTSWVGVCRSVRAEFIRQRDRDYVTAARAVGIPTSRIVFKHVLPNTLHLVLVSFSLLFVSAIKFEVILSFLGLGLEEGEASWGAMISQAKLELLRTPSVWWQLTTATVFMFGLVLCVNLFADALRDALDPRLKT